VNREIERPRISPSVVSSSPASSSVMLDYFKNKLRGFCFSAIKNCEVIF
jgi:hypothetical protein